MKQTVLITGANSFIAKHLIVALEKNFQVKLLTRTPKANNEYHWDLEHWTMDEKALDHVNYIVHLSGSKLNDGTPLTAERKQLVYDTRIGAADFLLEKLKARNQKLTSFVSASAIGYYGFTDQTEEINENGEKGFGFAAELSDDWEKAADRFKQENVADNVSKVRVSLTMGIEGGIFPLYENMVKSDPKLAEHPNPAATPWNHIEDMSGIFAFVIANNLDGVFNSVAPEPASQQDIFKAISNQIAGTDYDIKPFQGQHLVSHKIIKAGYQFKFPSIERAVADLLTKKQI